MPTLQEVYGGKRQFSTNDPIQNWEQYMNARGISMNDKEYDAAMSQLFNLTAAQQAYERSLPVNQVEQLMAAGMSRAQALQVVQGSNPQAAQVPDSSAAPSNYELASQAIGSAAQIASSIYGGIGMIYSIPSYKMQKALSLHYPELVGNEVALSNLRTRIESNNASQSDWRYYALDQIGDWEQIWSNLRVEDDSFEQPDNLQDMFAFARSLSQKAEKSEDQLSPAQLQLVDWFDRNESKVFRNPVFWSEMRNRYSEKYKSDYLNSFEFRQMRAQTALDEYDAEKGSIEIYLAAADLELRYKQGQLTDQEILEMQANVQKVMREWNLIDAQTELTLSQASLARSEDEETQANKDLLVQDFEFRKEYLNPLRGKQIQNELMMINSMDEKDRGRMIATFKNDIGNAYYIGCYNYLLNQDRYNFYKHGDNAYRADAVFQSMGLVLPYGVLEHKAGNPQIYQTTTQEHAIRRSTLRNFRRSTGNQ